MKGMKTLHIKMRGWYTGNILSTSQNILLGTIINLIENTIFEI